MGAHYAAFADCRQQQAQRSRCLALPLVRTMDQDTLKTLVGQAALAYVQPHSILWRALTSTQ